MPGCRIHEALALAEADLDRRRGSLLVPRDKGWRLREVGMDAWGRAELEPWLSTLGITSLYLHGIDNAEIIDTVHARRAPMVPVSTSLGR